MCRLLLSSVYRHKSRDKVRGARESLSEEDGC